MASDDVQVAGAVYLPGPSTGDAGISSLPVRFPWPLRHAGMGCVPAYDWYAEARQTMETGNPVCQPGKACVVQAEGKVAGSAWAPPSIRMDRANRARAERQGWEKGAS